MSYFPKQPASRVGTTQTIAYSTTTPISNAFGSETYEIKIVANSACHYHLYDSSAGASATATTSDPFLPANWIEYLIVTPGQKISAIQAATNGLVTATAGTMWVTELS